MSTMGSLCHLRLLLCGALLVPVGTALAANDYQLFDIPSADPGSYDDVKKVIDVGGGGPNDNIPANLDKAMCGGWDLTTELNGMFEREESVCPPSADEPVGVRCEDNGGTKWTKVDVNIWKNAGGAEQSNGDMDSNAKRTDPDRGLISKVEGVPGRENKQALGNIRSGMALRTEQGGDENISGHPPQKNGERTGFVYPKDTNTVCGLATLCRTNNHPDVRTIPGIRTDGAARDRPAFICEHMCQRPLDGPAPKGKPDGWDENDSDAADCHKQQPYEPKEDKIKYACGGGETKGPGDGFCQELENKGPDGGICEDMNSFVYILWKKKRGDCVVGYDEDGNEIREDVYLFEKGKCGFPGELGADRDGRTEPEFIPNPNFPGVDGDGNPEQPQIPNPDATNGGDFEEAGIFECCSDTEYPAPNKPASCITCKGEDCRVNPRTQEVIINDVWMTVGGSKDGPFVNDRCLDRTEPETHKREDEDRAYISFFRDYNEASYERAKLDESGTQPDGSQKTLVADDDHKKEKIPVACYGLYDLFPEDAKENATEPKDKHCTIGAYYEDVNFWEMKDTQKGKGFFMENLPANPFNDPKREFDEEKTLWFPELGNAFSLINDKVFKEKMDSNLTFTILAPDSAKQRATVQLDKKRPLSSGSLLRAFDDTVTNDKDYRKDRRSITEWWQAIETEMHEFFSPPIIRLLLATTWSIDLDPLDPIYTPPVPPRPEDEATDPRSETIEVQIEAREDLLGDVIAYMERARLLRVEGEPIPVVVPIGNPTELRIIAHGWEVWSKKQEDQGGPGASEAQEVADKLLVYAERMDDVRKLRAQLPRYAGALLEEQKVVSKKLAEWLTANIDAYEEYVSIDFGTQVAEFWWKKTQDRYRKMHNEEAFPWCRNDRFTTPIYSLLDPWMPAGQNANANADPSARAERDVTGGYLQYSTCLNQISTIDIAQCDSVEFAHMCFNTVAPGCGAATFDRYAYCVNLVADRRKSDGLEPWPSLEVCREYLPLPPDLPFAESDRDPDIVLDFTAFREPPKTIKLPILKPTQIRLDFTQIRPPALESNDEPEFYPELPDLPEIPDSIADLVFDSLPDAIVFKEAPVLTIGPSTRGGNNDIPKIRIPETDTNQLRGLLVELHEIISGMSDENAKFWKSVTLKKCEGGRGDDCVAPGTEQDCVDPYNDPKNKCVHFEGDLMERIQRIGARPAILIKDDYRSIGTFRNPTIHGQENCEKQDWVCQLLNARNRKPREGWMVEVSEDYDPEEMMIEIRKALRDQTSNIFSDPTEVFPYDFPQEQMFEIFRMPEGERIERRTESIDTPSS